MTPVRTRPTVKNIWLKHDGKEMVFVGNERVHIDPCSKCYFKDSGDACLDTNCKEGVYYEKQTYLELKLMGEIT